MHTHAHQKAQAHMCFFVFFCNDLYTANFRKWSCHSVISQLIRCQIVLNLDNTLVTWQTPGLPLRSNCVKHECCIDVGLVLKPADYSMTSIPFVSCVCARIKKGFSVTVEKRPFFNNNHQPLLFLIKSHSAPSWFNLLLKSTPTASLLSVSPQSLDV